MLYPHKPVFNYPGSSQIAAGELANKIIAQARDSGIDIIEHHPVRNITPLADGYFQVDLDDQKLVAKSIIIACGMGLFGYRRSGVPGEAQLTDRSVFYTLMDLPQWKEKNLAVIGGGNGAVDHALLLLEQGAAATIIHQLTELQAAAASVDKLHDRGSEILLGWKVVEFAVEGAEASMVTFVMEQSETRQRRAPSVQRVLINIGIQPANELIERIPCSRENRLVVVGSEMQTSIPGIFACGDVVSFPGRTRLIVTALGEAATAVNSVERYLQRRENRMILILFPARKLGFQLGRSLSDAGYRTCLFVQSEEDMKHFSRLRGLSEENVITMQVSAPLPGFLDNMDLSLKETIKKARVIIYFIGSDFAKLKVTGHEGEWGVNPTNSTQIRLSFAEFVPSELAAKGKSLWFNLGTGRQETSEAAEIFCYTRYGLKGLGKALELTPGLRNFEVIGICLTYLRHRGNGRVPAHCPNCVTEELNVGDQPLTRESDVVPFLLRRIGNLLGGVGVASR
jgi:thioredoxin reductase (NADPH)